MAEQIMLKISSGTLTVADVKNNPKINDGRRVDVYDWRDKIQYMTPLMHAIKINALPMIEVLLTSPLLKINADNCYYATPLEIALHMRRKEAALLLLADPRINVYIAFSPLVVLGYMNRVTMYPKEGDALMAHELLEAVLARGNAVRHLSYIRECNGEDTTQYKSELAREFVAEPHGTRLRLRKKLRLAHEDAAMVYAMTVLRSDGYLRNSADEQSGHRFFNIASQLPLELQMVLCNRLAGLSCDLIARSASEKAFSLLLANGMTGPGISC